MIIIAVRATKNVPRTSSSVSVKLKGTRSCHTAQPTAAEPTYQHRDGRLDEYVHTSGGVEVLIVQGFLLDDVLLVPDFRRQLNELQRNVVTRAMVPKCSGASRRARIRVLMMPRPRCTTWMPSSRPALFSTFRLADISAGRLQGQVLQCGPDPLHRAVTAPWCAGALYGNEREAVFTGQGGGYL